MLQYKESKRIHIQLLLKILILCVFWGVHVCDGLELKKAERADLYKYLNDICSPTDSGLCILTDKEGQFNNVECFNQTVECQLIGGIFVYNWEPGIACSFCCHIHDNGNVCATNSDFCDPPEFCVDADVNVNTDAESEPGSVSVVIVFTVALIISGLAVFVLCWIGFSMFKQQPQYTFSK